MEEGGAVEEVIEAEEAMTKEELLQECLLVSQEVAEAVVTKEGAEALEVRS